MPEHLYRLLPQIDDCLRKPEFVALLSTYHRQEVVDALRHSLQEARRSIGQGLLGQEQLEELSANLPAQVLLRLEYNSVPSLRKVINATGVPLHTNLGRAPLAHQAIEAVVSVARGYSTLEYDLDTGERGSRHDHVRSLLIEVTGAEDGMVVNNNAAAVLLMLSALAKDKEVVVSRGQLVEVGGSFRIPEVMEQGGAILREVGTTNKTHARDYVGAVNERTAAFLKVHTSNYRVMGFTSEVSAYDLASLAHEHNCLALEDLGSGVLVPCQGEPTVQEAVTAGMDVVTFSGDKLLGGPQAGIIVGKTHLIARLRSHPLARALRVDKMTLAALEATLRLYRVPDKAQSHIPLLKMLSLSEEELHEQAASLARDIQAIPSVRAEVVRSSAPVGGGSLPTVEFPGYAVAVSCSLSSATLEERLRHASTPVVARVWQDQLLLDPRTILPDDREALLSSLREVINK
jgi:L-seryl-tRNA(Ser) seleniumtransferase